MKKSKIFNIFRQLTLRKQRSLDSLIKNNKRYPFLTKLFARYCVILYSTKCW